jgi:hypothetical protein
MRDLVDEFRRRARARRLGRPGARYPEELRELAVSCWRRAAQEGHSRRRVAAALGIRVDTLRRWIAGAGQAGESMAEVRVLSGPVAAPGCGVVITPRGYRVEGLSVADLTLLLPVLG